MDLKTKLRQNLEALLGRRPADYKKIPIFINNFNRLSSLQQLIKDLEERGYYNLHIIDNKSTYPPLLEYYKDCPHRVHRLAKNLGFKAFWRSGLWYRYFRDYYCYTDSDLSLVENCPDDFMEKFYKLLKSYPEVFKVGFSLKIDDLPDHYAKKLEVIEWESRFFKVLKEKGAYIAPIDTTFALYRPFARRGKRDGSVEMLRTAYPYQCRHLPWYVNSSDPGEEELFYNSAIKKPTHWSG